MVSAHPKIRWQMGKTPATVAFVNEACVAYFTRDDIAADEKDRLRQAILDLVAGRVALTSTESVDEWLERTFVPTQYPLGALPPPGMEWQAGKTVASIGFVREAEAALAAQSDLTETEAYQLRAKIDRIKDGSESPESTETVESWLWHLRNHHP